MQAEHPLDQLFAKAEEHGIPMSRVCERAGIAPTTPSRWRHGKTRPTVDKLHALDVALTELAALKKVEMPTAFAKAAA